MLELSTETIDETIAELVTEQRDALAHEIASDLRMVDIGAARYALLLDNVINAILGSLGAEISEVRTKLRSLGVEKIASDIDATAVIRDVVEKACDLANEVIDDAAGDIWEGRVKPDLKPFKKAVGDVREYWFGLLGTSK